MCLTVYQSKRIRFTTLKTDLIVYKIGYKKKDIFKSLYRKFIYTKDKVAEKITIHPRYYSGQWTLQVIVNEAYHFYIDNFGSSSFTMAEFVIPKGSRILLDESQNMGVSNKIMFKRIVEE